MRRLFQQRLGLSHARNLAVQEATGRYILWTDDDVAVGPDWLAAYHAAFSRFPDAALFGGPVLPWFAARPPAWLRRAWPQAALYYAIRDCPPEPAITPVYVPFGANLAIRTDMQVSHPYDPALGRRGGDLLSGEDAQMVRTITMSGTAAEIGDRLTQLEQGAGVTEVAYQPAGDIPTELERFAMAAGLGG